ncbi:hypothetical protein KM043_007227 [Ampulex compressa]|nr:hypothetical protein KM043_007227 [Ampulex compressa]
MLRRPPLRTYQRKNLVQTSGRIYQPARCDLAYEKDDFIFNGQDGKGKNSIDKSLDYDPFETTFDRIAKDAKVPTPPPSSQLHEDTLWLSSSYDISNDKVSNYNSPFDISINLPKIKIGSIHKGKNNRAKSPKMQSTKRTMRRKRKATSVNKQVSKKDKRNASLKISHKGKTGSVVKKKRPRNIQNRQTIRWNDSSRSASVTALSSDISTSCTSQYNDLKLEETKLNILSEIETLKTRSKDDLKLKPCSVILDSLVVEQWKERRICFNNENSGYSDKNIRPSTVDDVHYKSLGREKTDTTKHCHISISRLRSPNSKVSHIKKDSNNVICSTPVGKLARPSSYLIPISPISDKRKSLVRLDIKQNVSSNINDTSSVIFMHTDAETDPVIKHQTFIGSDLVHDTEKLSLGNECEEHKLHISDQSNLYSGVITKTDMLSSRKSDSHSPLSFTLLPTQILLNSQADTNDGCIKPQINNVVDTLERALTQKYVKPDIKYEKIVPILNISNETDRSQSLFDNTSANMKSLLQVSKEVDKIKQHLHDSQLGAEIKNDQLTMAARQRLIKLPDITILNITNEADGSQSLFDNGSENMESLLQVSTEVDKIKEPLRNSQIGAETNIRLMMEARQRSIKGSDITTANFTLHTSKDLSNNKEDMSNVLRLGESIKKLNGNSETEKQHIESYNIANETLTGMRNESISNTNKSFQVNKDDSHVIEPYVLLSRLQDSVRITRRRKRYCKWDLDLSDIYETRSNLKVSQSFLNEKNEEKREINVDEKKAKHAENVPESSLYKSCIVQIQESNEILPSNKSLFLKPGKSWARSLSILNNIQSDSDLDMLSKGKGKKWRFSVKNILDMQKQGVVQSCVKRKSSNVQSQSCADVYNKSQHISINTETYNLTNHNRLSKRISIRVVPNNDSIKEIDDTPFLEVYGIAATKTPKSTLRRSRRTSLYHTEFNNCNTQTTECHATAKDVVLQRCAQQDYVPFLEYFPESYLQNCRKIGEGVYGEVFLYEYDGQKSVIKIIPIEGKELVNGEPQKKFAEILSEIVIAKELHNLRFNQTYNTSGFVAVKNIKCIIGKYPEKLVELWNRYDEEKNSDNDSPAMFDENQLYITLELNHGGQDLEAYVFNTAEQAYSLFIQTALALAIAEKALEFEHRDLHWGNVLICTTDEPYVHYNLGDKNVTCFTNGVKVSIIDFTLSRMSYQGCCIFNDLSSDPALFTAQGEYQFEIYRLMQKRTKNDWQKFEPYTNVLWLHYTLDKMITAVRYKKKTIKSHKNAIVKLKELKDVVLTYDSAFDFVNNCSVFKNLKDNNFVLESFKAVPKSRVDIADKLLPLYI